MRPAIEAGLMVLLEAADRYMRPVQVQSWICGAQHDLGTSHQSLERGER
jgi:hypothetical protein